MKIINCILFFILIVFGSVFIFIDSPMVLTIKTQIPCLFSIYSYSGDTLFGTLFSLNITIAFTIIGIAFAIVSLIIFKSNITFTAYIKYISRIDPIRTNVILVLISIIISLLSTYFKYTYIVEIWLKISLLFPVIFVFVVTKNVTRIESKETIDKTLLDLMLTKEDYIGFFNDVYKPINKENLFTSLSNFFFNYSKNTKDKKLVFDFYSEINMNL